MCTLPPVATASARTLVRPQHMRRARQRAISRPPRTHPRSAAVPVAMALANSAGSSTCGAASCHSSGPTSAMGCLYTAAKSATAPLATMATSA